MRRRVTRWLAAGALLAAPVTAQQADPPPTDAELPALSVLGRIDRQTPPARRLELIDQALALLLQPTPLRGRVLCGRATTLAELGREAEARTSFAQCRALRPNDPNVLLAIAFSQIDRQQPVEAAQLVIQAAALDPAAVRRIDTDAMTTMLRLLGYAHNGETSDRLTIALADSGWGQENPAIFSRLSVVAIRRRLTAGDRPGALSLLGAVLSPAAGVSLLIDRRYAAIWPQVETWAGADLSTQRRAYVDGARSTWETRHTPTDLLAYATALTETGHRAEAVTQLRRWRDDAAAGVDPYDRYMVTLRLGRLMAEEGHRPEAVALMMAALPDKVDEYSVNMVPNLVMQMLLSGDAKGALAILDRYTPSTEGVETPAALGYFVALRACAAKGVGDAAAAAAGLTRVRLLYRANDNAMAMALGCVGTPDELAAFWIARAGNEEQRGEVLAALAAARYRREHKVPAVGFGDAVLETIVDRADVRAAYDRWARPMPERYVAALIDFAGVSDPGAALPPAPAPSVPLGPVVALR